MFSSRLVLGLLLVLIVSLLCSCGGSQDKKFKSLQDLNKPNVTIAAIQGSASEMESHVAFKDSRLQMFVTDVDAYEALRSKKVDAVAYDRDIMEVAARNMQGVLVVPQNYGTYKIGIGINKENTALLSKVNAQLEQLEKAGTLQDMKQRWLIKKEQQLPADIVKNDQSLPVLNIGTSGIVSPWSFMVDNKPSGYDIELSWRIATALGMRPEFKIMNYDSLVAALEAKKVDLVLANLNETQERLQKIAFSKPYSTSYAALLVRKSDWNGATQAAAQADPGASAGKGAQDTGAAKQSNLAYKSIAAANGKKMAVVTGTVLDRDTEKYLPQSPYDYYNNYTDCLTALKAGKVEGFLCDEPVAREMQRTNPEIGYIKEAVEPDFIGVGINKNRQDLKQVLDAGITRYKQDGTMKNWIRSGLVVTKV